MKMIKLSAVESMIAIAFAAAVAQPVAAQSSDLANVGTLTLQGTTGERVTGPQASWDIPEHDGVWDFGTDPSQAETGPPHNLRLFGLREDAGFK